MERYNSQSEARRAEYTRLWIQTMSKEIKCLKMALKDHLNLNDEELEEWLIENDYKEG